jgi:hypothetical protein
MPITFIIPYDKEINRTGIEYVGERKKKNQREKKLSRGEAN